MSQIIEEPMDTPPRESGHQAGQTGFGGGFATGSSDLTYGGDGYGAMGGVAGGHMTGGVAGYTAGGYLPPPSYQAALDGSDGAVSSGRSSNGIDSSGETDRTETGGYWLRQRR